MKFIDMTVQGFLSFRHETTVPLNGLTFAAVVGENGNGKTALISAVAWALYGDNRLDRDKDSIVNDYEEVASVELTIEDRRRDLWKVRRVRKWHSKTELTVARFDQDENQWITASDHRLETGEQKIAELTSLSEDAFFSLMFLKQKGGSRFIGARPQDRISILLSLLPDLDKWNLLESVASRMSTENGRKIDSLEHLHSSTVDSLEQFRDTMSALEENTASLGSESELNESKTSTKAMIQKYRDTIAKDQEGRFDLSSRLNAMKEERRVHNSGIKSDISGINEQITRRERLDKSRRQLIGRLDRIQEDRENGVKEIEDINHDLQACQKDAAAAKGKLEEAQQDSVNTQVAVTSAESQLREKRTHLKAMEMQKDHESGEGVCLVCQSPLSHDKLISMWEQAQDEVSQLADSVVAATKEHEASQKALKRIQNRIEKLKTEEADLNSDLDRIKNEADSHAVITDELNDRVAEVNDELKSFPSVSNMEDRLAHLREQVLSESDDEAELRQQIEQGDAAHPLSSKLSQAERELDRIESSLTTLSRLQGKMESTQESIDRSLATEKEAVADLDEFRSKKEALDFNKKACSNKGVPSMLIGSVLIDIEDRQNQILERLMGERAVKVEFKQERALKSREGSKELLDIIVHTPDGFSRQIETFSGGEQVRLMFSNLLAMIEVFNERSPGLVRTLVLDEPLGNLDARFTPIVVDIIRDALNRSVLESVLLVTHDQAIIDSLPQRLTITRGMGLQSGSTVEMSA